MELEKAISQLKKFSLYYLDGYDEIEEHETKKAIEVVLKELEESKDTDIKLYKRLNIQERVIDEMAGMINTRDFGDICKEFGKYQNCSNYIKEGLCEKCIKEYFYKKVEELGW